MKLNNFKKILVLLPLLFSFSACGGGGGGGGGGGASFKNSIVLLQTNFGYCIGTFISKTSVLTTADCIWGAKYIQAQHKNGNQYASQYYWNGTFRYSDIKNNYCTLDPNNTAIVKFPASYFDAIGAKISELNFSETIYPSTKLPVWGFGTSNGFLDINQIISKRVTFVSFENNSFLVTDDGARDLQFQRLWGGHPLISRDSILGLQVCNGYNGGGNTYAFVGLRSNNNPNFIASVAPDSVPKSTLNKVIEDGIANVKELAQEGASEEFEERYMSLQ